MTKDKALVQKISYLKDVLNYLFDSKKRVAQIIQIHDVICRGYTMAGLGDFCPKTICIQHVVEMGWFTVKIIISTPKTSFKKSLSFPALQKLCSGHGADSI